LVPLHTIAQKPAITFRHITIEDGLSQGAVYAICQDRQGFIWIGTKDGLNKYDGYRFSIFQNNPFDSTTLSSSYISEIFEDSRGFLWVGTLEGGLNRMDRKSERFHRYVSDAQNPGTLGDNRIAAIAEDSSGGLWIGTAAGLNYLPAAEVAQSLPVFQKFKKDDQNPQSLSSDNVKAILVDRAGGIWIGTTDGLNYLKALDAGAPSPRFRHFRTTDGLMDEMVFSIYQTKDGTIWAGSISGLNRYDPQSGTFTQFPHHYQIYRKGWGQILDIEEDNYGRLWLATPDELMIFDRGHRSYRYIRQDPMVSTSLNSNGLTRIIRDQSGVFWLATNGYGLNLYDPKADRFNTFRRPKGFPSRLSRFSITSILEDRRSNIWIGADVLYRWNRISGELKSFETDSEHPADFGNTGVWSILQDSSGVLWVASSEGLYRYDPVTGNSHHFNKESDPSRGLKEKVALNVFNDRAGGIWVATESFFSRYDASAGRFIHYRYRQRPATRSASFTATYQDPQGIFWLATDDGLARFDSGTETFRYFRTNPADPHSLSNDVVLCIYADPRNPAILWLGTAGGGLNRFDKITERFEHYTEEQGMPNNVVYGVLPDEDGNLWLSTNRGLSRFNPATGEFRNFDVRDGLQSNEFNTGAYFKSRSGEIFFGGVKGLSYFFPTQIKDNPHIPNVVITGLRIFNREATPETNPGVIKQVISQSNDITLSYRQNVVSFEFAALDYSSSSRNQYAYKMEGFNEDWIPAGAGRTATFTNLPAGSYRFRVKGSNNDGVWNESGASLVVHVTPPPWRTWWAYSFYFLTVLGVFYGIRRYELNRLRLKNRLRVEQLEGEKLRDLDQMKTRFFANISHEFRTPLTLILGQIDRVLGTAAGKEERRRLEVALGNARRLLRLINQLLDLSKLEANSMSLKAKRKNIIPFLKNLIFSFESLAEQKGVTLQYHSSENCIELPFEPDKLEKVFYNLLSNAF
ncbi:MAG: two-component regulator propeller domain-containing protein, partial [Calditrichia bacterium]